MNEVQQRLFKQIVEPAMRGITGLRTATIREVDYVRKVAKIAYTDNQKADGKEIKEVSIVRQNGIHEAGPFPGDTVLIGFLNNDLTTPIIVGPVDYMYEVRRRLERDRHERSGALLSDLYTQRSGERW